MSSSFKFSTDERNSVAHLVGGFFGGHGQAFFFGFDFFGFFPHDIEDFFLRLRFGAQALLRFFGLGLQPVLSENETDFEIMLGLKVLKLSLLLSK